MGDNVSRNSTVTAGSAAAPQVVDQWFALLGGNLEITIESNSTFGASDCFVRVDGSSPVQTPLTLLDIRQGDLASGPHKLRFVASDGISNSTFRLLCLSDSGQPSSCTISYTFKWSS
jgi:hypothetical protein